MLYFLQEPILSVQNVGLPRQECSYIPAGEVISIADPDTSEAGIVEVSWNTRTVFMFRQDVNDRAVPVG